MKKILLIGLLVLMLVVPVASAFDVSIENESKNPISTMQDFTHTVFSEYGTLTTCPPCVIASAQLYSIYNSGDFEFYYVTLVYDRGNVNVRGRLVELGVVAVPDVFFDGGFLRIKGSQASEIPYRNAITQSGEREVADLDIAVDVAWLGGGKLDIEITVVNNENEDFNGHIRTYVVEKESRWNDNSGKPYHYAALDIPIDKNLAVVKNMARPKGETYTFSKTWRGGMLGFGNITQENTMVIVSVFDKDTGYVVETAAAEPAVKTSNYRSIELMFHRVLERFRILGRIFSLL
ncbi:hypothetical protein AYK20_06565 [Thermoplasmatales archaeon SG8-52-1]|nr:MAG: hypothetical protein AYK20_06565 [Thermoplasmatales archaeon SG8-52-1]